MPPSRLVACQYRDLSVFDMFWDRPDKYFYDTHGLTEAVEFQPFTRTSFEQLIYSPHPTGHIPPHVPLIYAYRNMHELPGLFPQFEGVRFRPATGGELVVLAQEHMMATGKALLKNELVLTGDEPFDYITGPMEDEYENRYLAVGNQDPITGLLEAFPITNKNHPRLAVYLVGAPVIRYRSK